MTSLLARAAILACCLITASVVQAQDARAGSAPPPAASSIPGDTESQLAPLKDAATVEQIREYVHVTGALDAYRARWIEAVDRNRSIGAPYWPEEFWTSMKTEMQKADLMPMYVTVFQHFASRDAMQAALDAFHKLGPDHFADSPEFRKISEAEVSAGDDEKRITMEMTRKLIYRIYAEYKPQIKAARARYLAEHPDWKDK